MFDPDDQGKPGLLGAIAKMLLDLRCRAVFEASANLGPQSALLFQKKPQCLGGGSFVLEIILTYKQRRLYVSSIRGVDIESGKG